MKLLIAISVISVALENVAWGRVLDPTELLPRRNHHSDCRRCSDRMRQICIKRDYSRDECDDFILDRCHLLCDKISMQAKMDGKCNDCIVHVKENCIQKNKDKEACAKDFRKTCQIDCQYSNIRFKRAIRSPCKACKRSVRKSCKVKNGRQCWKKARYMCRFIRGCSIKNVNKKMTRNKKNNKNRKNKKSEKNRCRSCRATVMKSCRKVGKSRKQCKAAKAKECANVCKCHSCIIYFRKACRSKPGKKRSCRVKARKHCSSTCFKKTRSIRASNGSQKNEIDNTKDGCHRECRVITRLICTNGICKSRLQEKCHKKCPTKS